MKCMYVMYSTNIRERIDRLLGKKVRSNVEKVGQVHKEYKG